MHEFRNDLYHVGIQHEKIISSISMLYFEVACHFIGLYEPPMLWWCGDQKLPERAKKYFHRDFFMPGEMSDFKRGCNILAEKCNHVSADTVKALADHMGEVIEGQSTCIDIIADGVYEGQQITRDRAVIDTYVWSLALSDEGKAFAEKQGWSGSIFELRVWLAEHYPLQYRRDPIPSWRRRASKIRRQENPHTALLQYYSFMKETANLREAIVDISSRVSAEIDRKIDSIKWR